METATKANTAIVLDLQIQKLKLELELHYAKTNKKVTTTVKQDEYTKFNQFMLENHGVQFDIQKLKAYNIKSVETLVKNVKAVQTFSILSIFRPFMELVESMDDIENRSKFCKFLANNFSGFNSCCNIYANTRIYISMAKTGRIK